MNFLHLKYALEVERTGSITRAAENLYMNQPHLSKAIRELEDSAGITIFSRTSKGVIPTRKGKEFLTRARDILVQVAELESLGKPQDNSKAILDISAVSTAYLSSALAEFIGLPNADSSIYISCHEHNMPDVIENVAEFGSDLGILRIPHRHLKYYTDVLSGKGLEAQLIADFDRIILLSAKHSLAESDCIGNAALTPFIRIADNNLPPLPGEQNDRHIIKLSARESRLEILSRNMSTYMITCPLGEEMLERYALIQKKYTDGQGGVHDYLICRKNYRFNDWEDKFTDILKQEARKTAENAP